MNLKLVSVLLGVLALSGCNDIPSAYVGQYAGTVGNQTIQLDLRENQVSVTVNGKPQALTTFVSSFNQALSSHRRERRRHPRLRPLDDACRCQHDRLRHRYRDV
jgi:hypothetical protein